ncbi:MAG TPA: cobalamin-binding protein [Candidatus Acidoferrales bacterium]|jgi:iron complex transport system substrate-binding protein|nr:cobalamin-binding protein [Candidatus Acidoferrales bacterium]
MPRIVSLISSATEIAGALGQLDNLVGRSHECDYPEGVKALPVCTRPRIAVDASSQEIDRAVKERARTAVSIYDVFEDVIERLEPTHILTQVQCEVCAVSLRDVELALARGMKGEPRIVSLQPDSLAAIWDDVRRVAGALGIAERGETVVGELQARMSVLAGLAGRGHATPRVACIEWMEPLMAAGNWTPELIEMAGGINLFGEAGKHSPWMTWDALVAADPDVIVIAPCGFDLARTEQEIYWMTERPGWNHLRAVQTGRVYLADGNQYFNRPGPRVVETLQILVEMLHGAAATLWPAATRWPAATLWPAAPGAGTPWRALS